MPIDAGSVFADSEGNIIKAFKSDGFCSGCYICAMRGRDCSELITNLTCGANQLIFVKIQDAIRRDDNHVEDHE